MLIVTVGIFSPMVNVLVVKRKIPWGLVAMDAVVAALELEEADVDVAGCADDAREREEELACATVPPKESLKRLSMTAMSPRETYSPGWNVPSGFPFITPSLYISPIAASK